MKITISGYADGNHCLIFRYCFSYQKFNSFQMGQQAAFILLIILTSVIFFQTLIINSKIDKRFEELNKKIEELFKKKDL